MAKFNAKLYINGRCVEGKGAPIDIVSPIDGQVIATIRGASVEQTEEALQAAQNAFHSWSHTSLNDRIKWMRKLRDECLKEKETIVELMALEGGKSFAEATNDYNFLADYIDYYAEEAKRVYDTGLTEYGAHRDTFHVIVQRPIGVVVGHLAWNMPISNVGLKMSPSMASGCTCVLKPSTATPLASFKIGELAERIGLPPGVLNFVTGPAREIGNYLSASTIPAMVSVIGSTEVGKEVMKAGATSIKRFSMELGGNAPCIVMPDCDFDTACKWIASRKVRISGQGCANINRIFVHESIHDKFVERLVELVSKIKVGWGDDIPDAMGPMINVPTRDKMIHLVEECVSQGGKLLYGGGIPEGLPENQKAGAYSVPAILDSVTDEMALPNQEIFGPIYAVMTFSDLDDCIARANRTRYGLSGYLFTHDARVIGKCVEELEVGELQVNLPGGGPNMPHIGLKDSGIGCDRGLWSLAEYYNIRRISIKP